MIGSGVWCLALLFIAVLIQMCGIGWLLGRKAMRHEATRNAVEVNVSKAILAVANKAIEKIDGR